MTRRTAWLLAGVLATGLIAAGCGGDDDENGEETETTATATVAEGLSKAEFIEQANQICKEGQDELQQAVEELGSSPSDTAQEQFVTDTLVPILQRQVDEIQALGPPDQEAEDILAEIEAATKEVADDPSLVTENEDPFAGIDKRLNAYGLTTCTE